MVKEKKDHLEALQVIRNMMERSTRFISLSGLSGIAAGICALLGAVAAFIYLGLTPFDQHFYYYDYIQSQERWGLAYTEFFLLDAGIVLVLAVGLAIFFTSRKARNKGQRIWGPLTFRLLVNLGVPLVAGGIFIIALYRYGDIGFIAPATLIFYGLALINASKYTLNEIRYLGVTEIALGSIALFYPGFGLEFWTIGFGVLHIIYGALMYYRHER
jgi:hypothetical protein